MNRQREMRERCHLSKFCVEFGVKVSGSTRLSSREFGPKVQRPVTRGRVLPQSSASTTAVQPKSSAARHTRPSSATKFCVDDSGSAQKFGPKVQRPVTRDRVLPQSSASTTAVRPKSSAQKRPVTRDRVLPQSSASTTGFGGRTSTQKFSGPSNSAEFCPMREFCPKVRPKSSTPRVTRPSSAAQNSTDSAAKVQKKVRKAEKFSAAARPSAHPPKMYYITYTMYYTFRGYTIYYILHFSMY
jgi:hypothetical protein